MDKRFLTSRTNPEALDDDEFDSPIKKKSTS